MIENNATENPARIKLLKYLKDAAAKAVKEEDPWAKHDIPSIPAERVIRHLFHPETNVWSTDETIVKMEQTPFTHGAMRYCYRMKKRATPPRDATNHRFHAYGWDRASNYVAKAYFKDGFIDTSQEAKDAVKNDILLQYEASYWAEKFNASDPPKKISFIRAYAMEFPNRPGQPWFAVERFISGKDSYGAAYIKHNTNSGFVDLDLHRRTPQVFSAYSFYASQGTRLVADIQGVGNLYTDPQVLSNDYRFGDGDLGPRGMALFFKSFRHCQMSDALGVPIFKLSRNELKTQNKYDEDEFSADDSYSDVFSEGSPLGEKKMGFFARLDENRQRRQSIMKPPVISLNISCSEQATDKRSNVMHPNRKQKEEEGVDAAAAPGMVVEQQSKRESMRASLRTSFNTSKNRIAPHRSKRTKSDTDDIQQYLEIAKTDAEFSYKDFNRKSSGELRDRHKHSSEGHSGTKTKRRGSFAKTVQDPMIPTSETRLNLGKVHFQLAILHGMGRFGEVQHFVEEYPFHESDDTKKNGGGDQPSHDAVAVLFHLAQAASLKCTAACLALARVQAGMETIVSELLPSVVHIDFDSAKILLSRALHSDQPPTAPKAAAGCLLYQIFHDEKTHDSDCRVSDEEVIHVLEVTLGLLVEAEKEAKEVKQHHSRDKTVAFNVGDRVEGNYFLEGTFYPGTVGEISEDGKHVTVRYDDDGSTEQLTLDNVKLLIPPNATQTNLGGPLADEEALGFENSDEKSLIDDYELQAELAELLVGKGEKERASALFEEAANGAINAGKMKTASQWSLKAAELL